MNAVLIYLATAAFGVTCFLAGRSTQMRTNQQMDARMRDEIARLGKAIAAAIQTQ